VRTGVAKIINHEPDLDVIAEAANGVEALAAFDTYRPDVTLLDLRMPVMEGVEVVRRIRERDPNAKVIVLTTYDTDDDISRALKAGAKAYVLKDISADDLIACIHDVLAGKTYLAPAAAAKLAEGLTRVQLTPRELSALRLMADGKANKEIANTLGVSERTGKPTSDTCSEVGRDSRTEAVKVATRRASCEWTDMECGGNAWARSRIRRRRCPALHNPSKTHTPDRLIDLMHIPILCGMEQIRDARCGARRGRPRRRARTSSARDQRVAASRASRRGRRRWAHATARACWRNPRRAAPGAGAIRAAQARAPLIAVGMIFLRGKESALAARARAQGDRDAGPARRRLARARRRRVLGDKRADARRASNNCSSCRACR
jgi:DNA-binding NarL/FixJ family response regulator